MLMECDSFTFLKVILCGLYECVCICTPSAPWRSEGIGLPGAGGLDCCEPSLGPLQEQQVLLAAKSFFPAPNCTFLF